MKFNEADTWLYSYCGTVVLLSGGQLAAISDDTAIDFHSTLVDSQYCGTYSRPSPFGAHLTSYLMGTVFISRDKAVRARS
jgi:hypothetical protein